MKSLRRWKSGAAAMMAMAITTGTVAPIFILSPANAQYRIGQFRNRDITIQSGARIPTTYEKDKILVSQDETVDITLTVPNNITDNRGNILIPRDSKIRGRIQPATISSRKGAQFVAREIEYPSGRRQSINATSNIVTRTETITRGARTNEILTDAAYGAGAAAIIGLITGNRKIEIGELLAGGGAGALASILLRRNSAELISIDPQTDLTLRLTSPLTVSLDNR
ncbi:MAG: conjugal transfer protein TrbI [Calothrix sp. C42_A2020_038]|nr:conjugal transfer protein TrbI [Calothrix sp. C42_A2020_038]